jgi:hypothetical protein
VDRRVTLDKDKKVKEVIGDGKSINKYERNI